MKTFVDNAGRTWAINVNVAAVRRVKDLAKQDLLSIGDGDSDLAQRLASDPMLLVDVLYALCQPEAQRQAVSDEHFGEAMAGDAIDAATAALLEELVNFFPSGRRMILRKAIDKMTAVQSKAAQIAGMKIDQIDVDALIEQAFGSSSSS